MAKNKNQPSKKQLKRNIEPKSMALVVVDDSKKLGTKFWLKFKDTYLGASFINLHFALKSRQFLRYESKLNPNVLINYNLLWFLIYTLLVGILGFTWMIFIPALTNLSLAVFEYVSSVINRSQK